MKKVLIRFNTKNDGVTGFWRAIFLHENGAERLYSDIQIAGCRVETVKHEVPGIGTKYSISVEYSVSSWTAETDTLILV